MKRVPLKAVKPNRTRKQTEKRLQESFPLMLRLTRAALGWSQADLARHARLNQRAIVKLEQGETRPRRKTLEGIRDVWRDYGLRFEVKRGKLILVMSAF